MNLENRLVKLQTDVNTLKASQIIGADNTVCFVNQFSMDLGVVNDDRDYIFLYATNVPFPICSIEFDVYENNTYRPIPASWGSQLPIPGSYSINTYDMTYDCSIVMTGVQGGSSVLNINGKEYNMLEPNIFSRGLMIYGNGANTRLDIRLKSNVRGLVLTYKVEYGF